MLQNGDQLSLLFRVAFFEAVKDYVHQRELLDNLLEEYGESFLLRFLTRITEKEVVGRFQWLGQVIKLEYQLPQKTSNNDVPFLMDSFVAIEVEVRKARFNMTPIVRQRNKMIDDKGSNMSLTE
jgi:hypothetical protein